MDRLENKKLAIIGVGHMGTALAEGLVNSGFKKDNIILSNRSKDNKKVVLQADYIIIAVKPLIVCQVIEEIKDYIKDKLLISAAAAVSISSIEKYTENRKQKIIRLMPNISVMYNQGIIGFYANKYVSEKEKEEIKNMLSPLGMVVEVKNEKEIDILTVISGCGPAMVTLFINLLSKTAKSLGLSSKVSERIAMQTFKGTVYYLQKTGFKADDIQKAVTTKGGITEEIIQSLEKRDFSLTFEDSVRKGYLKIKKPHNQLHKELV